ncbi:MAG: RNA 2',3'-cyclic phosphodiesterase [Alteromonadaceae bacterium]|nr:RNA 2',3'-cyclic phosphodiesterase [Alteromonadaceae bacterium]
MRLFFGLDLAPQDKIRIAEWREKVLPPINGEVPPANFHVTLAFLGQVTQAQLEPLSIGASKLDVKSFSLRFEHIGYFSKPKALWLGCESIPAPLQELQRALSKLASAQHLNVDKREYTPHITLFRKCAENPPVPLLPPDFVLKFDAFSLFCSENIGNGVFYRAMQTWALTPSFSFSS